MLGDMMGNMQQKQAELKEKLGRIVISEVLEGVIISGTANKVITNIEIEDQYLVAEKKEELEDLLTVAINNFCSKVAQEEAKASQNLVTELLPGMGSMFGM